MTTKMGDLCSAFNNMTIKKKGGKKALTPYQGEGRVWGEFKCSACKKKWSSGNSWANMGQQCKKCLTMVYPYEQRKLKKSGEQNNFRPHLEDLCQKCQTIGYNCRVR